MSTKLCTTCALEKELAEFNKKHTAKDGHRSECRKCQSVKQKQYASKNKTKDAERLKVWRKENPDKVKEQKARNHERNPNARVLYRKKNLNKIRITAKAWVTANKERVLAYAKQYRQLDSSKLNKARLQNLRRAIKLQATVSWDKELTELVEKEAYHVCLLRKQLTSFRWELDHIIPLQGETVCGLHVWNNFASIPATLNASKGNDFNGNIHTGFTI